MSKDIKNENKDLDEFEFDFEEDSKEEEELEDFDFDDDSENSEENDDFDFDDDSEENKKEESEEDDFDFDADDNKEDDKEEVEEDFDFDSEEDSEESDDDFDFDDEDKKEEVESIKEDSEDFDFDDDEKDIETEEDFDFEESSEKEEEDFDFDSTEEKEEEKTEEVEDKKEDFDFEEDSEEETEEDFDFDNEGDEEENFEDEVKLSKEKEEKEKQKKLEQEAFEDEDDDLDIEDIFSSDDDEDEDDKDDLEYVNDFINKEDEEEDFEDIEEDIDSEAMKVTQNLDIKDEDEEKVKKEVKVEDLLQKKKSGSSSLKKIIGGILGVAVLGGAGFAGFIYKDDISAMFSGNSLEREADSIYSENFEKRTSEIAEKIVEDKVKELNKTISEYENKISEIELNQVSLMNKNKMLENNTKEQETIINTIQKNDNKDNQSMLKLQQQLEEFIIEIDSVKEEQLNNKELLKKTVEATLNLIKENKMLDKDLEAKIYDRVYTEFKKVFDSQRFRLNDLSIIEGKLNEALSFNKKILQDLKQAQIDNQKLMEEQRDLSRKIIKLEKEIEKQDNQISTSVSNNDQNNVINLLKKNNEEPKNAIIIDKKADNASTIPEYHLQGIIGGNVAYIKVKGQEGSRARAYSVGDTLDGYGKILKIETSYIVTEKGELRRERR